MVERVVAVCRLNVSADYWSHEQKVGDSRVLVVMKLHIIFHPSCQPHAHDTLFVVVIILL